MVEYCRVKQIANRQNIDDCPLPSPASISRSKQAMLICESPPQVSLPVSKGNYDVTGMKPSISLPMSMKKNKSEKTKVTKIADGRTQIRQTLSVEKRQSQMNRHGNSDSKTRPIYSDATNVQSRATSQESQSRATEATSEEIKATTDGTSSAGKSSIFSMRKANNLPYVDPTEEMNKRWLKHIQKKVPTIDLVDISAEVYPFNSIKRQFAPEYSYAAYLSMLRQEYEIGNYLKNPSCSL